MTVINPGGGVLPANIGIFRQGLDAAKAAAIAANLLWFSTDTGEWFIANAAGNAYQSIAKTSAATLTAGSITMGTNNFPGLNVGGGTGGNIGTHSGTVGIDNDDWSVHTAGKGVKVAEGANAKQGTYGPLVAGTLAVANTSVTANSRIFVCRSPGGTNPGAHYVSALTAATGFTVTSTNAADTGGGFFIILEPG